MSAISKRIIGYDGEFGLARGTEATVARSYIKEVLSSMGKGQIEELRKQINEHYLGRFTRNRKLKYGSLNKGFTEQQIEVFFRRIDNPKHKLLFRYQSELGLRVGEAVCVNIKDINFESRELRIFTEKARQLDSLRIPLPLYKDTIEFAKANKEKIEKAEGYLFFSEGKGGKGPKHVNGDWARNAFRKYLELSGLDEVYGVSDERDERRIRRLHRLTTHSLRHYAITRFSKSTNGNIILTSRFARHLDTQTTMTYINTDKKEIYEMIDTIAVGEIALMKKRLSG